jgi:hypothetical protein
MPFVLFMLHCSIRDILIFLGKCVLSAKAASTTHGIVHRELLEVLNAFHLHNTLNHVAL